MNGEERYLVIVENGIYRVLATTNPAGNLRFTTIAAQAAMSPESSEFNFESYEGQTVMISGHQNGGWVYSASVIDQAGPILTTVVKQIFSSI